MLIKRVFAAAGLSLLALTSLSACGSGRPTGEELGAAIREASGSDANTAQAAKCVGQALAASKLSDDALVKIVETDGKYFEEDAAKLPAADQKVIKSDEFLNSLSDCIEAALPPDEDSTAGGTAYDPASPPVVEDQSEDNDPAGNFDEGTDASGRDTE